MSLIKRTKSTYSKKIVGDLKSSNKSQWYSKIKRMSNISRDGDNSYFIEELSELEPSQQADQMADYYASTRNQFQPVCEDEFSEVLNNEVRHNVADILTTPEIVEELICSMNKKSACVKGDVPFKIINYFSSQLSKPLCNIFNTIFIEGKYPEFWKIEYITLVPKCHPPTKKSEFRPISSLLSWAKISDKLLAKYITEDMTRDERQYGNEKGLSINHYLVKMIHKILQSVDKNSANEKN